MGNVFGPGISFHDFAGTGSCICSATLVEGLVTDIVLQLYNIKMSRGSLRIWHTASSKGSYGTLLGIYVRRLIRNLS